MNNEMAKITCISKLNLKIKLSKKNEKDHGYREHFDGCQMGGWCRGIGEEAKGLRSTNK